MRIRAFPFLMASERLRVVTGGGEEGYFLYDVEEAVDYDHESQDETEQRHLILEIRNPQDWPPAIDVAELTDLLTATARERWSVDFACMSVTRRSVESGDGGTGLNADSPMPDGILSIFEELRYDSEQALLRLIGERSIVSAWVETRGGAGQVNGGEFVRDSSGPSGPGSSCTDATRWASSFRRDQRQQPSDGRFLLAQTREELSGDPERIRTAGLHLDRVAC